MLSFQVHTGFKYTLVPRARAAVLLAASLWMAADCDLDLVCCPIECVLVSHLLVKWSTNGASICKSHGNRWCGEKEFAFVRFARKPEGVQQIHYLSSPELPRGVKISQYRFTSQRIAHGPLHGCRLWDRYCCQILKAFRLYCLYGGRKSSFSIAKLFQWIY